MVVDDDVTITLFLRALLEKQGHHTCLFNEPRAALQHFEADPGAVDLVISDQTMPEMTGSELAIAMFARRPDLPFLLCSGYSDSMDEQGAKVMGITGFLQKPYRSADLLAKLREVLPDGLT